MAIGRPGRALRVHPPKRRIRLFCWGVALSIAACMPVAAMAAPVRKPNVVLVYFDDLNDWVEPFSRSQSITPNLTAFARRSVVFNNAMTASPVCNPSRVAMLTGLHPTRSGVYDNHQIYPSLGGVVSTIRNLPQHFQDNGYLAAGYGKIFHHRHPTAYVGKGYWTAGYESPWSDAAENALRERSVMQIELPELKKHWGMLGDDWDRDDPARMQQDTINTNLSINFLHAEHDRPFFLALGIYRPHTNWYIARRYWDLFPVDKIQPAPGMRKDDLADVPPSGRNLALGVEADPNTRKDAAKDASTAVTGKVENLGILQQPYLARAGLYADTLRAYLAAIAYADDMFGRFISALDNSEYADNTIVVVVSDHGYHVGEKDHWHKSTMWERAIRVPMLIRNPVAKNYVAQIDTPVSLLDVFPTIVDIAGMKRPRHNLDGISLRNLLEGKRKDRGAPVLTTLYPGYHSVRDDTHRYIRYPDGTHELYAIKDDPWEWTNLAHRGEGAEIVSKLDKVIPSSPAPRAAQAR
jgi:arylsulfatase A-like enzyme